MQVRAFAGTETRTVLWALCAEPQAAPATEAAEPTGPGRYQNQGLLALGCFGLRHLGQPGVYMRDRH